MSWAQDAVFYHIYPLGFCGAPEYNDFANPVPRLDKLYDWIPHLKALGITAVYFGPVFQSTRHGYDTADYYRVDSRLGDNDSFAKLCDALHQNGIRVVLDGVFNHVGRDFWAFQDVQKNGQSSPYCGWFHNLNFGGPSPMGDPFWYTAWQGHYELVKLNLRNPDVVRHLLDAVGMWMDKFHIDGLRLDAADCVDFDFFRTLKGFVKGKDPDFWLMGETIHGDYARWANPEMLDSVTNYECYKGLYSAFNSLNLFEIAHSLARQFGPEPWTLYKGEHLFNFADNHDVSRVATILTDEKQLPALYAVLFSMPGIPCLYYGSEWGATGDKHQGDDALRPCFDQPQENELTAFLAKLAQIKAGSRALNYGDVKNLTLRNKQWILVRQCPEETAILAVNAEENPCQMECAYHGPATELLTGEKTDLHGTVTLPGYGVKLYKMGG